MSSATVAGSLRLMRARPLSFLRRPSIISDSAAESPPVFRSPSPLGGTPLPKAGPVVACPDAVASARRLLEESHDLVVDAVRFVAARHRLARDTGEELRSRVMLHLVANDYAVLRRWRRECSLHTYLVTVITRVYLDYRNQEWGKSKPPALARRRGPEALLLWRLTHRTRLSFDEAVQTMQADHGVVTSRDDLWDLFVQFPPAAGRYFVDVGELAHREQPGGDADGTVQAAERQTLAARVDAGLESALEELGDEDRLVLKLFFTDGLTRAQIARLLLLDQQRLYPRFLDLLTRLRTALTAHGVSVDDVRDIVGEPSLTGSDTVAAVAKNGRSGPSLPSETVPATPPRPLRPRNIAP